jgi:predicted nucleic acid-binding protein
MPGRFFDTNVVIYIASGDAAKADKAEALLSEGGAISVQVLNEIANVAQRKMRLSWERTHAFLTLIRGLLAVHPVDLQTHETGLEIAERHRLSIYASTIVASALRAECDTLWSEDMQNGLLINGRLRIVNPFRAVD